ncbi:MAG: ribonuclease P protein component [Oscillospiraceae bacterium]|nr:ribonuclease P protein component [Oscillospiraceae bacterium]
MLPDRTGEGRGCRGLCSDIQKQPVPNCLREGSTVKSSAVLNRNGDFIRLYKRGKSMVHPLLVTYTTVNRRGLQRVGLTSGKKIGGAVQRNRARRVIRAAFQQLRPRMVPTGWDIVFVARTQTCTCSMQQVQKVMEKQLTKLGLLLDPAASEEGSEA